MGRFFLILGMIMLLILGMSLVSSGDNRWMPIGPGGITVTAIAINPQAPEILYIGTDLFGIFKSIDGGATWTAASTGLNNLDIMTLAINPQTPDIVYAGTFGGGVFGSIDGGTTWTSMNTGFPSPLCVDVLALTR